MLVLIGIVAALALPGYRQHMLRVNRTEAMTALLQLQSAEESHYLRHDVYTAEHRGRAASRPRARDRQQFKQIRLERSRSRTTASRSSPPPLPRQAADKTRITNAWPFPSTRAAGARSAERPTASAAGSNNVNAPHAIVARMKNRALVAICTCCPSQHLEPCRPPTELKIATWNLEWFMTPETLRALTPACTPADAPRDGARRCGAVRRRARARAKSRRHRGAEAARAHARCGHRRAAGSRRRRCGAPGVPRLPVLFLGSRRGPEQWLRHPARTAVLVRARTSPISR